MSKVNTGFLSFVNKKKYSNIPNDILNLGDISESEDQADIPTPLKLKPKQIVNNKPQSSSKIKENEIIFQNVSQNENNLNDGSLKSLLERLSGKVIEKEFEAIQNKDHDEDEEEEQESESENDKISDSEESDYEEEKYNHFIKNRLDIVQDADEQEFQEEEVEEEEAQEEPADGRSKLEIEIFVDNIPTYLHEKQIIKFFRDTDRSIARVKVLKDQSGNHRGKAYLKFSLKRNALNLIKKGVYIDNKRLKLDLVEPTENVQNTEYFNKKPQSNGKFEQNKKSQKKDFSSQSSQQKFNQNKTQNSNESSLTVFVRNLPADIDENIIKTNLKKFGKIKSVRFMKNNQGKNKNFGYIDFYNSESVEKAVANKEPLIVGGKQIIMEKAKSSFDQGVYEEGKRLGKKKQRTLTNVNNKNNI
jgi:RNA recognition motif-containing protein